MKKVFIVILSIYIIMAFASCQNDDVDTVSTNIQNEETSTVRANIQNAEESTVRANIQNVEESTISANISNEEEKQKVKFTLGEYKEYNNDVVEEKEHSVKYYSYMPTSDYTTGDFTYYDVAGNKRVMTLDKNAKKNDYAWEQPVDKQIPPKGHNISYGIDISKHNDKIDFKKVKEQGFDFVFIRIAYRGYGQKGNLLVDEMQEVNMRKAKEAGLKVGAYVFSQSTNENEAIEEADLAISLLKDYELDLPLVYDPETIKGDIARTDDIDKEQWTKNCIAFCERVKEQGYTPCIYANMTWQDYYLDMSKLNDYEIWFADYSKLPQSPYHYNFWQFSEVGIVDGIEGFIDLNVMIQ